MAPTKKLFTTIGALAVGSLLAGKVMITPGIAYAGEHGTDAHAGEKSCSGEGEKGKVGDKNCSGDKKCGGDKGCSGEKSEGEGQTDGGEGSHDHGDDEAAAEAE